MSSPWAGWGLQGEAAMVWSSGIAGAGAEWLPALKPTGGTPLRKGPGTQGSGAQQSGSHTVLNPGSALMPTSPTPVCGDHSWGGQVTALGSEWRVGPDSADKNECNNIRAGYYHVSLYGHAETATILAWPYVQVGASTITALIPPPDFGQWKKPIDQQVAVQDGNKFYIALRAAFVSANAWVWWDKIIMRCLDQCSPTALEAGICDPASVCIEGDCWGAQR